MSDTTGFSRIYQFLAKQGDWQTKADANGDGIILRSEFDSLLGDFEWDGSGGYSTKEDLIAAFFKTIDTKTSGKITGTKYVNYLALDKNEQAKVDLKVQAYEILEAFMQKLNLLSECPASISNKNGWKQSVADSLAAAVETYLKSNTSLDGLEAYLTEALPLAKCKATADYFAYDYMASAEVKALLDGVDFSYNRDTELGNIISAYIQTLSGTESADTIQNKVTDIIKAYLKTANLGEGSAEDLSVYGLNTSADAKLNEIQRAVALKKLNDKLANISYDTIYSQLFGGLTLTDSMKKTFEASLQSVIEGAKTAFIDTLVNSDFANIDVKINEFDVVKFVTDDMKQTVYQKYGENVLSGIVETFIEQLVEGITKDNQNSAILSVYSDELGDIKLDKDNAKKLGQELSAAGKAFVANYVASGEDITQIETALKDYLKTYLLGGNVSEVREAFENHPYGALISEEELEGFKEHCIMVMGKALSFNPSLKLGGTPVNLKNYKDVINAYTDGDRLMSDMEAMIDSMSSENVLKKYMDAAKAIIEAQEAAEQKAKWEKATSIIINIIPTIQNEDLTSIIGKNSLLNTEFGMDKNGNIVFESSATLTVYNTLYNKIKSRLQATAEGKDALSKIGEDGLKKIVQAAWIMTYNTFNSSTGNNSASFISAVLDNLSTIMSAIKSNPALVSVYTGHTAYANSKLTTNLIHYGAATTAGNDEVISYEGAITTDENGAVHIANSTDDLDYQATMNALLQKLIKYYDGTVDSSVVTSVFRNAQKKALEVCQQNITDLPYGTDCGGSDRVEDAMNGKRFDWTGGRNDRKGDHSRIDMDELVQITLYNFDKLLYQALCS